MTDGDLMWAEAKAKAEGTMSVYSGAELTDNGARYWLTMDGWDVDQSALLLHAIDPMQLNRWAGISSGRLEVAFPVQYDAARALIARAFEAGALQSPAKPCDVIAWAKSKGLRLPRQFLDARIGGANDAGDKAKPEWAVLAREIGNAWMQAEEKRTKRRPGIAAIARYVEGELSSREIVGQRGRFLDWETIKREALTGITGRKKGENLKRTKGNPHLGNVSPILKGQ